MTVLDFSKENNNLSGSEINMTIDHVYNKISEIERLLEKAPYMLERYMVIISILKDMKRGRDIDSILTSYNALGCPPDVSEDEEEKCFDDCTECWKVFLKEYIEHIKK